MTYEKVSIHQYGAPNLMTEDGVLDSHLKMFFPYATRASTGGGDYTEISYYEDEEKTKLCLKLRAQRQSNYNGERGLRVTIYHSASSISMYTDFEKRWYEDLYVIKDDENNVISLVLLDGSKNPILVVHKDTNENTCCLVCVSPSGSGHSRFGVYNGSYYDVTTSNTPFAVHANFARGQSVSLAKLPTNDSNNSRSKNVFLTPFTPYYPSSSGGLIMDTYKINDSTYLMNQIMAIQLT